MKTRKSKKKRSMKWNVYSYGLCIIIAFIALSYGWIKYQEKRDESMKFVLSMGAGFNLGNTLDAHGRGINNGTVEDYETYWGNPVTTKEHISAIKEAGFSTIRIPVTWYEHMDEKGLIDPVFLDRVQAVVDYAISNGLYVILDVHHDPWIVPNYENETKTKELLNIVWGQIAQRFASYDTHLLFEGMNEPRLADTPYEWNEGTEEARAVVNHYNETFVNTVRSVPGNEERYLLIATYCNSSEEDALRDFVLPKDDHLIVSIHEYIPYEFAMDEDGTKEWSASKTEDTEEVDEMIRRLSKQFIKKKIPVIITEFGAANKNNLSNRLSYTKYYVSLARRNKIMCIWWDEGGEENEVNRFQIFDRYKMEFIYPEIAQLLVFEQQIIH